MTSRDVLPSVDERTIGELAGRISRAIGPAAVSTDPARIDRVSVDWAHMSPILAARLPAGRADLVVTPATAEQVPLVLAHAYDLGVPVTPRGTGLGNYGQAIPLLGGVVLDLSNCRAVLDIGPGRVAAEAGVRMRDLDNAVAGSGQELAMYPSTKGSTLGGFLAGGSAGTGSISHGTNADGFVLALDVAPCDGGGGVLRVEGPDTLPYIHAYGVTGIIIRATVQLTPRHAWTGVYAAAPDYDTGTACMRALREVTPAPRVVSLDEPEIVAALPKDTALDPGRVSVRAIVTEETVDLAERLITACGGTVLDVRPGPVGADRLTALSYNHSTFHLQKRRSGLFHLELAGDALWRSPDAVRSVFPGTMLHLDLGAEGFIGMLMAPFSSAEQVYAGIAALRELGVDVHSPHEWTLDRRLDLVQGVLPGNDPRGLLNPGKLPATA